MSKPTVTPVSPDELKVGGEAFEEMLSTLSPDAQIQALKKEVLTTKSPSKRDAIVKKLKYLAGLKKLDLKPEQAYILRNMPVVPPSIRPVIPMGGNRIEFADINTLYKDHMLVNNALRDIKDIYGHNELVNERKDAYEGVKAVFGLGDAISGSARGKQLKGFIRQISGDTGPKGGYFHSKLLSKKQDFSGRATIYAEPNLGFNEVAVPKDMLWTMYEFHIVRDLVRNGYDLITARKEVERRGPAATNSFNKMVKNVPVILNRAPTLMRTNITAHFPVPIEGKTLGINPLHLPMYAGDFDGDALTIHVPMTPEAVEEAKQKLLPQHHIHDYRMGLDTSIVAPGHEAVIGAMAITEPDHSQATIEFDTEEQALAAFKKGEIKENTPVKIKAHQI
ncbi:DNA-directed RNA polymerase subunit beta' [compost metagenome]